MTEAAPPVLLPYQARWVADRSSVKVAEKSRRIGITWATAVEAVLDAAARDGEDVWYIGYNEDQGLEFIRDAAKWAVDLGAQTESAGIEETVVEDERGDILAFQVRFSSGYRITALTSRPRNLRGKQGYVVIDEAAYHDDLDELLKAAIAMMIWGGRVAVISTHFGADNPFSRLVDDVQSGVKRYSLHRNTLDDALADGLYRRICLVTGKEWSEEAEADWRKELFDAYGDAAEEELLCIPSTGGGVYFPRAALEACATVSPDVIARLTNTGELDDPKTRRGVVDAWCEGALRPILRRFPGREPVFLGHDFARSVDLSVLVLLGRPTNGPRTIRGVVELRNVPHEAQVQIDKYVCQHITLGGGAIDAGGNGSYLGEAMHEAYRSLEPIQITQQWYVDVMPQLKAAVENRGVLLPDDEDSLDDMAQVRLHNGIPKLVQVRRATSRGARHGDFAIALALAHSSSVDEGMDDYIRAMQNLR